MAGMTQPSVPTDADPALDLADEDLAFSIGVQAWIWGYPLVVSAATALVATGTDRPLPNGHAPFNAFGHVAKLFKASDRDVVSPNGDTVYSSAFLDLKAGAVLVSVPASAGRYYSLMLEDAYTNVFGYIGTRATGPEAGRYLFAGPGWSGSVPADVTAVITAPTPLVWIIGRTLVDGDADLAAVRAQQAQYTTEVVGPALDPIPARERWGLSLRPGLVPVDQVEALDWSTYYAWVGRLMRDNPAPESDGALVTQFARIGLNGDEGFALASLSGPARRGLERAHQAASRIVKREALGVGGSVVNGWAYNLSQGRWGQDFPLRAAIAYRSLGQNTPEEAIYFNTRSDADGLPLNGARPCTLTCPSGQLPPTGAFWSITMYDATNFFADNPISRFSIGDRTPGLRTADDGSLTIAIQREEPEAGRSNWLPAPEGDYRLSLRLYIPKPEVLSGEWAPPPVRSSRKT